MADVTETVLIGGGGNDWGNTILCQSDGACALFGYGIKSFGESTDLFAAMQSPQGKWLWANTYGGTHKDELRTAIKTSDGGYLLVGMSQSLFFTGLKVFGPSRPARPFLLKIGSSGEPQWAATIGQAVAFLVDVKETLHGEYILIGGTAPDAGDELPRGGIAAVKLSREGELRWAFRYDIGWHAFGSNLLNAQGGGFTIIGNMTIDGKSPLGTAVLLRLDAQGTPLWAKIYSSERRLFPVSLVEDGGGGFLLAGGAAVDERTVAIWASRLSSIGDISWSRVYGRAMVGTAISAIAGDQGDFLLIGRKGDASKGDQDGCAILVNGDGRIKAATVIGGKANDEMISASSLGRGRYRLIGDTESFPASYVDMLVTTWIPGTTGNVQVSEFMTSDMKVTAKESQVQATAVVPNIRTIPIEFLEVKSIRVPRE